MADSGTKKDNTPNAKVFNIVLPQDLVDRVDKIASDEYRNRSETIREALRNYVDQNSAGRKLHGLVGENRESGNSLKSLELSEAAMAAYESDKDKLGFAEIQADRAITFGHLSNKATDPFFAKGYLILARNAAKSAVELAEESGEKTALAIPYLRYGKALEDLGEYAEAGDSYQKAVDNIIKNPPVNHNRAAVVADFKIHLYSLNYLNGDKSALQKAEDTLKDFEKVAVISDEQFEGQSKHLKFNQEISYNYNVWHSGAYMRLAAILRKDDPKKALSYLEQAKKIINSDPRLILRSKQAEVLEKIIRS